MADWEEAAEEEREEETEDECLLLPENESVLAVFEACEFDRVAAGMHGVLLCLGISAKETMSACRLLRIPAREWPWVRPGVQIMASIVVPKLNQEAAERSG